MSAPITEAHRELARNIMFYHTPKGSATAQGVRDAAQLIADSEAEAVQIAMLREYGNLCATNESLAKERDQLRNEMERFTGHGLLDCHAICDQRDAAIAERDQLRAALALGQLNCDEAYDDLRAERDALRAEVERLKKQAVFDADHIHTLGAAFATRAEVTDANARAERAEAEVKQLNADGAASAFVDMSCRASRAEAELANIRALANRRNKQDHSHDTTHQLVASLDQSLDIVQAALATERARLDDLVADIKDACITLASAKDDCDDYALLNTGFKLTAVRDVLIQYAPNAAMKEGAK